MKKQNVIKKNILSLILVLTTFLTAMIYPNMGIYEGLTEVSAWTDASSSFKTIDGDDENEVTPGDESADVTVPGTGVPSEVVPTPKVTPLLEISSTPLPEVTLTPSPALRSTKEDPRATLPSNATIVNNYGDLTNALSQDNGFEIIYLGSNIYAGQNGITIHPSKQNVIIDGALPGSGITRRTFTEFYNSHNDPTAGIHISAENTTTKSITFQNTVLVGINQAGIITIPDSSNDVTVCYQNISYSGPQIVTNPSGTVQFVDCYFTMENDTTSAPNYVAVANHIELKGANTISSSSYSYQAIDAVFLPTNDNPRIDILRNASFLASAEGYFLDIHSDTVDINIHQGATFDIDCLNGFTPAEKNIKNMLIGEDAYVVIVQEEPQTRGTLRIEETLEMLPGSDLTIMRKSTLGSPIIFPTNNGRAIFNNPERVTLFSPSLSSIDFEHDGYIKIIASSINAWGTDMVPFRNPHYIWNNSNNKMLTVESIYKDGHPVSVTHSLEDNSPSTDPLTPVEFDLSKIRLLIFGRIILSVDPIYLDSTVITGTTEGTSPNFKVNVSADYEGLPSPLGDVEANSDGTFSFNIDPQTLDLQNPITIITDFNSLSRREIVFPRALPSGTLAFTVVPSNIDFNITTIPAVPTKIMRTNSDFSLSVSDTRNNPEAWRVDASITQPLTATLSDNTQVTLPNALVFVDEQGKATPLSSTPLPIYYENSLTAGDFNIFWDSDRGLLINISPGNIYSDVTYSTTIYWDLVDAP